MCFHQISFSQLTMIWLSTGPIEFLRYSSEPSHVQPILKRLLYLTLVHSQLTYCSPVWRPQLIKHIQMIKSVQKRAMKYILNNFSFDYKSRLVTLGLLPLMYYLELNDVIFCIHSLQFPKNFDINEFVTFSNCYTRSSTAMKMSINSLLGTQKDISFLIESRDYYLAFHPNRVPAKASRSIQVGMACTCL